MGEDELGPTARTTLRRKPERGRHDRATVHAVLDAGLVCHVGFAVDGAPVVIPTTYARAGDVLYFHGARSNRMFRVLAEGAPVCATVTLLDGLVLARSAFRHSMNYRSVMVFGTAEEVTDTQEKLRSLAALVEHVAEGRSADTRGPDDGELDATLVVRMAIREASAKTRTGGPSDHAKDLHGGAWAGVVPLRMVADAPVPAADLADGVPVPGYALDYRRPGPRPGP